MRGIHEGLYDDVLCPSTIEFSSSSEEAMMFELDEELESLSLPIPGSMWLDKNMHMEEKEERDFGMPRPSNPVAYLLENHMQLPMHAEQSSPFMSVSVSPRSDQQSFIAESPCQRCSDELPSFSRIVEDEAMNSRKRKLTAIETTHTNCAVMPRRLKPCARRALSYNVEKRVVWTADKSNRLPSLLSTEAVQSEPSQRKPTATNSACWSAKKAPEKHVEPVRARNTQQDTKHLEINRSLSITIPTRKLRSELFQFGSERSHRYTEGISKRSQKFDSGIRPSSFDHFCRSWDASSPLRLRFRNLMVRSYGRTRNFDAS